MAQGTKTKGVALPRARGWLNSHKVQSQVCLWTSSFAGLGGIRSQVRVRVGGAVKETPHELKETVTSATWAPKLPWAHSGLGAPQPE